MRVLLHVAALQPTYTPGIHELARASFRGRRCGDPSFVVFGDAAHRVLDAGDELLEVQADDTVILTDRSQAWLVSAISSLPHEGCNARGHRNGDVLRRDAVASRTAALPMLQS